MKPVSFSIDNNILYTQGLYIMATITVWLLLTVLHESYWQCCPLPLLALSQCRQLEKKAGEIGGKMERKNGESVSPLHFALFPSRLAPPPPSPSPVRSSLTISVFPGQSFNYFLRLRGWLMLPCASSRAYRKTVTVVVNFLT